MGQACPRHQSLAAARNQIARHNVAEILASADGDTRGGGESRLETVADASPATVNLVRREGPSALPTSPIDKFRIAPE